MVCLNRIVPHRPDPTLENFKLQLPFLKQLLAQGDIRLGPFQPRSVGELKELLGLADEAEQLALARQLEKAGLFALSTRQGREFLANLAV